MDLTILGPNLGRPLCDKGETHVHHADCRDLRKREYFGVLSSFERHDSVRSVVESYYGPQAGSFYYERDWDTPDGQPPPNAWEDYASEFWFAPCCSSLPMEA